LVLVKSANRVGPIGVIYPSDLTSLLVYTKELSTRFADLTNDLSTSRNQVRMYGELANRNATRFEPT